MKYKQILTSLLLLLFIIPVLSAQEINIIPKPQKLEGCG